MSDHITIDGKKYYSEEYFQGSLASSKRRGERIAELEQQRNKLREIAEIAATRNDNGDYCDPEYLYDLAKQALKEIGDDTV